MDLEWDSIVKTRRKVFWKLFHTFVSERADYRNSFETANTGHRKRVSQVSFTYWFQKCFLQSFWWCCDHFLYHENHAELCIAQNYWKIQVSWTIIIQVFELVKMVKSLSKCNLLSNYFQPFLMMIFLRDNLLSCLTFYFFKIGLFFFLSSFFLTIRRGTIWNYTTDRDKTFFFYRNWFLPDQDKKKEK